MHISFLLVNLRERAAREWLLNRYRIHQRLCMAFRSTISGGENVHTPRGERNFLFRVDENAGAEQATIIVQSGIMPNWDSAFNNRWLVAPPEIMNFDPIFETGSRLRFRIFANPVRRISRHSTDWSGEAFDPKWYGKRVPVAPGDQIKWLERRVGGKKEGFVLGFQIREITYAEPGYEWIKKSAEKRGNWFVSALYEGILEVTDAEKFENALVQGIGPGKAFGFGLLTVELEGTADSTLSSNVAREKLHPSSSHSTLTQGISSSL